MFFFCDEDKARVDKEQMTKRRKEQKVIERREKPKKREKPVVFFVVVMIMHGSLFSFYIPSVVYKLHLACTSIVMRSSSSTSFSSSSSLTKYAVVAARNSPDINR